MDELPHIIGSPPEGGKFRLVKGKSMSFVGMILRGPEGKEKEEEVNLAPGVGTRVVFTKTPRIVREDGHIEEVPCKEAILCKMQTGSVGGCSVSAMALLFPHAAYLLDWFEPGQKIKLYGQKGSGKGGTVHYDTLRS